MPPLDYILLATAAMAHKNTTTTHNNAFPNWTFHFLFFPFPFEFLSIVS